MRWCDLRLSARMLLFSFLFFGIAEAQEVSTPLFGRLDCESAAVVGAGCVLELAPDVELGAIRARAQEGGERRSAELVQFNALAGSAIRHPAQAVILIDTSTNAGSPAGARAATMPQIKAGVAELVATLPNSTETALLVYDREVDTLLGFGASDSEIVAALDDLSFEGRTTRTFAALDEAIDTLKDRPGLTHAIYLFTDGIAEDAASSQGVIRAADEAGISISPFISHWEPVGRPSRGEAETRFQFAADRTGGVYAATDLDQSPDFNRDYVRNIGDQIASGGVVRVANAEGSVDIEAELVRDSAVGDRRVRTLSAVLEGSAPAAPPPAEPIWKQAWFLATLGGVLLLIAALVFFLLRRRQREDTHDPDDWTADPPATDPRDDLMDGEDEPTRRVDGAEEGPVLARLVMASDGAVYDVRAGKLSIGRSDDNEIVLRDDSISRIHCELHKTRDGSFAITDLQSLNETRVNGMPVSTHRLRDGDQVKLGEVEFIFREAGR